MFIKRKLPLLIEEHNASQLQENINVPFLVQDHQSFVI